MQYLRNFEISQRFSISEGGVRYLIKRAQSGRLSLQLIELEGKTYIANTAENLRTIEEAIRSGKKHLTKRARTVAEPTAEFYDLYSPAQVLDIINNIEVHREIPRQYNYFDGGADSWDKYVQRLYNEKSPNTVNATVQLLATNATYIDTLVGPYQRVNVIDVGVGNAWPVKDFLGRLLAAGKLNRYVAIDISESMLDHAERYVKQLVRRSSAVRAIRARHQPRSIYGGVSRHLPAQRGQGLHQFGSHAG